MRLALLTVALFALVLVPFVSADVTITSIPPTTATLGLAYSYQVLANYGTNNTLNYSITGPSGMAINATGFVSFIPSSTGVSNVTINVTNGTKQVNQSYVLTVSDNTAMSFSIPLLGGPKQKRSNPKAANDARKNFYAENKFVLRNTGTNNITDISFTSTTTSKFNVSFSNVPSSLGSNQEATITLKARVPEDFDAFIPDKTERKQNIGEVRVTAKVNGIPLTVKQDLFLEAENILVIRDVTVHVRGRVKHVDENERVDNLKVRDTLQLEVDVENLYGTGDNENIDVEDAVIAIDTVTKEFDVDNKIDMGSIRANAIETGTTSFSVKDDADAGVYKMTLEVTGKDDNGALHGDTLTYNLEIVRKQNEVSIEKITLLPEKITCKTKEAILAILLHNTGKSNEEKGTIKVESKELGFSQVVRQIKLAKDDTAEQKFTLPLKPGKAAIQIEVFYDEDKQSAVDGLTVEVPDCAAKLQEIVRGGENRGEEKNILGKNEQKAETAEFTQKMQELVPVTVSEKSPLPYVVLAVSVFAALGAVGILLWLLVKEA